uniref:Uncharacterized protein n=1 Tax=Glycine max TaxID=3847 RepID=A0A0R0G051_SOYBN
MQGPEGGRDPFFNFGDLFVGFGGFDSFGPPGIFFPPSMNLSWFLEHPTPGLNPFGFFEHPTPAPKPSRQRRGPIIQELHSDEENENTTEEKKGNSRKHGRSNGEPFAGNENKINIFGSQPHTYIIGPQPQSHSFCFQSSTVNYGCPNGKYYTSSRTRRSGRDGLNFEERKEADSSTRQASHLISRGIHGKGHSFSRNLNSDGRVDTRQTFHNINEEKLAFFRSRSCEIEAGAQ